MAVKNFTKSNFNPRGFQLVETIYYTSNATFTKATYPWLRAIRVKCQGAGGGGGGAATTTVGQVSLANGGSGGAYAESFITDIAGLSASVTVTVGSGGAGGAAGANNGSSGGTTSFGSTVSANGGQGGFSQIATNFPNVLVNGTSGQTTATGDLKIPSSDTTGYVQILGGLFGDTRSRSGPGGNSLFGKGGNSRTNSGNGEGQNGQGSGGGGALNTENQATARAGAVGAAGIVIVELFA
jgi:hypothetical protein